ncbi:MAG: hypothetical protein WB626_03820 [Bacteroidota bacterium]
MLDSEFNRLKLDDFGRFLSDPNLWVASAQALFASAQHLSIEIEKRWLRSEYKFFRWFLFKRRDRLEAPELQSVYLMLIAFCLENLLKAHLVKNLSQDIRSEVTKTGKLPQTLNTHDLNQLAKTCGIDLDSIQNLALYRLTVFSWRGRYLLPITFRTFDEIDVFQFSPNDLYYYDELVKRMATRLGLDLR